MRRRRPSADAAAVRDRGRRSPRRRRRSSTLGAEGRLICFAADTGKVIWQRDFRKDFGVETPVWGWASHPLVDGDRLLCVVGGKGSTAVAFDKRTGKELWRALSSREPGYAPPMIYRIGDRRQLLIWHGEAINGLDPETGGIHEDCIFGLL